MSQIGRDNYRELDPELNVDKNAAYSCESTSMRALMAKFDAIKVSFPPPPPSSGRVFRLDLPPPLDNLNIPDVVNYGEITIKRYAPNEI